MRGCLTTVAVAVGVLAFSMPAVFTAPEPRNPTGDYWIACRAPLTTLLGGRLREDEPGVVFAETRGPAVAVPVPAAVANDTCRKAAVPRVALGVVLGLAAFLLSLWGALRLEPHIVEE